MNDATHPLTEFFRREGRRLVSFVRGRIEDSAELEAEDLVQDVFAALFERSDPLAEVENLSAYVWRSLRNRVVDALRRRRPTVSLDQPLGDEDGLVLADILASDEPDALEELLAAEELSALSRVLETLDSRERELIRETEFEGRTFRELSEEWQVPIGTLLSRKSRAIRKLAVAMDSTTNRTQTKGERP
jgi:RNA polymerase sigma factor (sigma-70 family)